MTEQERSAILDDLFKIHQASNRIALYIGPLAWNSWHINTAIAHAREWLQDKGKQWRPDGESQ